METRGERSNTFPHQQEHSSARAAENAQIPLWDGFSETALAAMEAHGKAQESAAEAVFRTLSRVAPEQLDAEIDSIKHIQADHHKAYTRPDILGAIGSVSLFLPTLPKDRRESVAQAMHNNWVRAGRYLWLGLLHQVRKEKSPAEFGPLP